MSSVNSGKHKEATLKFSVASLCSLVSPFQGGHYTGRRPLITRNNTAMMAITNKM